jgi:acyl-CoA thioester hydrolase
MLVPCTSGANSLGSCVHKIYEHRVTVQPGDIDGQGHVNNLVYLKWLQDAAVAHSDQNGWSAQRYHELGVGWVVRSHWIEYLNPAFQNDAVVVTTWIAEMKMTQALRKYRVVRTADQAVLAVAQTNWVFMDMQSKRPRRIDGDMAVAFPVCAEGDG